jgi:hypothetical protein
MNVYKRQTFHISTKDGSRTHSDYKAQFIIQYAMLQFAKHKLITFMLLVVTWSSAYIKVCICNSLTNMCLSNFKKKLDKSPFRLPTSALPNLSQMWTHFE